MAMKTQSASLYIDGSLILSLRKAWHSDTVHPNKVARLVVYLSANNWISAGKLGMQICSPLECVEYYTLLSNAPHRL